jgi:hypothetical protein
MHSVARPTLAIVAALVLLAQPIFAFIPIDESFAGIFPGAASRSFEAVENPRGAPAPKTGPYISS